MTIFILIVTFFDFAFGSVLRYFYFKQESGPQYRTTYSIEKNNADLLIFGSSRASHHYKPDIFEKKIKLSYYNTGRDGNFIFYYYAVLKCILKRYKPKIIVLDISRDEFLKNTLSYERISFLLPYYDKYPEIRPIIELKSPYEKIKLRSSIYPYNSSIFTIIAGNSEFNKNRKKDIKGYIPIFKSFKTSTIKQKNIGLEIDNIKVKIFEEFIKDCVNSNIKLFIVCSPYYFSKNLSNPYNHESINIAQKIAIKNNIMFFDYSNDLEISRSKEFFSDPEHLNNKGADVFSNKITDSIIKNKI